MHNSHGPQNSWRRHTTHSGFFDDGYIGLVVWMAGALVLQFGYGFGSLDIGCIVVLSIDAS